MMHAAHQAVSCWRRVECYRDYAGQVYMRNTGASAASARTPRFPATAITAGARLSTSGTRTAALTWTSPGYRWLAANAGEFGWNHPGGVNEAWHWEWVGDGGTMHGYPILPNLLGWAPLPRP